MFLFNFSKKNFFQIKFKKKEVGVYITVRAFYCIPEILMSSLDLLLLVMGGRCVHMSAGACGALGKSTAFLGA